MVLAHDFAYGYWTTSVADVMIFAQGSRTDWKGLEYVSYRDNISRVYGPMSSKAVPSTIHGKLNLCTIENRYRHVCGRLHIVFLWRLRLTVGERMMPLLADLAYIHNRMATNTPSSTYISARDNDCAVTH
jgi:hypothetical protein